MLRVVIHATPNTDVDAETQNLRRAAENAQIEPELIDRIVDEANTVVHDFVDRGRELKALGSQFKVERAIRGESYDIRISFDTVPRSGVLARILGAFGR